MYKKLLFLFIGIAITGFVFMSCSDDDSSTNPPPTPECTILSPNGGEVLQMGNVVKIKFENDLTDTVAMHLYKGGNFLMDIEAMITTNDSLEWYIPTTLDVGTDYKVKIGSIEDSTKYDFSDNSFAIAPAGDYIIVTSSNGGDIWLKGSTKQITWYDNISGSVNLFLLKNGVPVMDIFGTPQASNGTKSWTIPNDGSLIDGADYTLQIVSVDNPAVNDISDSYFCLATNDNTQNIVGEWDAVGTWTKWATEWNFIAGGTFTNGYGEPGTWYMVGNGLKVEFDLDTHSFLAIVNGNHLDGTMSNVAGAEGTWYADRVIPELLTPNGGEVWMHGTMQTITWDPGMYGNVVLSLADSTGIVQNIATVADTLGTYDWTVPSTITPGAAYLIRIAKEINAEAMDESDNYICIADDDVVDITGQWYMQGSWSKWETLWTFNGDGTFVNDLGSSGTWVLVGSGLRWDYASGTYYIGNVGVDVMSGTQVDGGGTAGAGWSGHRLLDITAPNGGEFFQTGNIATITWTTNITAEFVKIDLYENDVFSRTLFANNVNNYSKNWTIPADLVTSTKYKVRITSTTAEIYDESDSYFTIDGVPATPAIEDETFDDGLAQNWTTVDGNWTLVDSLYQAEWNTTNRTASVYLNTGITGNYMVESRCRKVQGNYYYGIIMNGDHSIIDATDGMWNSMQLLIDVSGGFWIAYMVDGSWNGYYSTSTAINTGLNAWNVLKVIVNNDTNEYHFFANDQYIVTVTDTHYNHGEVGLLDYSTVASETEYDYVKISPVNKSAMDGIKIKRLDKQNPVILGSRK